MRTVPWVHRYGLCFKNVESPPRNPILHAQSQALSLRPPHAILPLHPKGRLTPHTPSLPLHLRSPHPPPARPLPRPPPLPPLAGRLSTHPDTHVISIVSNDQGADFIHANAAHLSTSDLLSPTHVPDFLKDFFALDGSISYDGHFKPLLAVQVTELADGVFVACTVNHAVTDGTSFWNFFNTFAEMSRLLLLLGGSQLMTTTTMRISRPPDFRRNFFGDSTAVLRFPDGSPKVTFDANAPLKERIFHFTKDAIAELKSRANAIVNVNAPKKSSSILDEILLINVTELMGKMSNDRDQRDQHDQLGQHYYNGRHDDDQMADVKNSKKIELISSFQSLCAQLWRSITRARNLDATKETTFRMAANCRHRVEPKVDGRYFGNAIQSIPTSASAGEILSRDLHWIGSLLRGHVAAHDDSAVRRAVESWERSPECFPLGNFDGAMVTMGSSPRFPMYDNDFGWGPPVAVRSGRANKFDGKISAFPGRDGDGSVDLEVCLKPETMAGLEADTEFMQYVTVSMDGCDV
ncbi:hypothetical protein Syun_000333 [Stephania yunnanensis]|uniref:Uncharacterized protein n=1 Tax=Stephania yunnanensis TaxID=152371 RepID=A0AAP0LBT5_9MAGN